MPPSLHSDSLFEAFFDLSLTGGVVYDPVRDAAGAVVDFTFARLNPAAQRVLQLPAQVSATYLEQFPAARTSGAFGFHCEAFASEEPRYFEQPYQADGYDLPARVAARRVGQQLLVSFTDTSAQPQAAAEQTLGESRAREQAALAEVEAERLRLHQALTRIPANIALLSGPEHRYALVNSEYERLFPGRPVLGRTIREVIPELEDQGFYELFDRVYQTGEPYYEPEAEVWADFAGTGELQRRYYRTTFEPIRNAQGKVTEVLNFAVDVTAQVEARQQVEQLNRELTAARAEAERQRGELWRVFEQAPLAIAVYRGPTYTIELANPTVCRLWGRRQEDIVGLGLFEALPEVAGMGYEELLDGVMTTGQPVVMHGMEAQHDRNGHRETVYWDFVYEPMYAEDGSIYGAMVVANEVTEQVTARRQLEQLNHELEARVLERTRQLQEQQQLLSQILGQVPAAIATLSGPEHRFTFANDLYRTIVGGRANLGRTVAEVQPEMAAQGYLTILDRVYATGEPFVGQEQLIELRNVPDGEVQQLYADFVYQPLRDAKGHSQGILTFAVDVTDKVLARRQAEAMQAALLAAAQRQAQQREELYQVFEQAPAAILLLREPNHRIEYVNPAYQRLFPGVALRGRLLADAHPRATADGIVARFDRVYDTGETYVGEELPLPLTLVPGQPPETHYFNYTYQPYREAERIVGVSVFAYDVTEQVLARRAAAQRLHAQQAELRRIFEQAPVGIYLMRGPEFVIDLINETAADMWGTVPATMLGRSWLDIAPGLDGSELLAAWQQMLHTGEPYYQHEVRYKLNRAERGKPNVGYFNVAYQAWHDEQNQLVGIIAVGIEVTEQVQARQQVEQLNQELEARVQQRTQEVQAARAEAERERALLQALFAQAPVAIALFQGPEVRVASANARMAALWGRTPEQVMGRPLVEGVPELAGQGFDDMIREVQATRVPYIGTEAPATILQNGVLKARYYNFSCQPVYDFQGGLLGVINVGTEVTEQVENRRRIEQLNQELEARVLARTQEARAARAEAERQRGELQRIFEQAPVAITVLRGPRLVIELANAAMSRLWGRPASLTVGQPHFEALPETVGQGFEELLHQVLQSGQEVNIREAPAQLNRAATGQPEQAYVNFSFQPLVDEHGTAVGIVAVGVEVTEQVLARRQVQNLNEELQATNAELHATNRQLTRTNTDLDTFVYTASHDLKAPITNIEGLLSALRDYLPPHADPDQLVPRLLGMMENSVARFQQTIGHLTEVSRLQDATEPAEALPLARLVEDVRLDLAPLLAATRGQLLLDLDGCPTVYFSPKNLRSILYNLLSNAFKYRAPDRAPVVQLRAHCPADQVVIEVQDNGLGLSAEQQGKLFALFRRLHTHVEGSGVGLYMLKRIVENAGGTIALRSELGVGSTFTVTLPHAQPRP